METFELTCDNLLQFLFMFSNSSHNIPITKYFVDRLIDLRNSFNFLNRCTFSFGTFPY